MTDTTNTEQPSNLADSVTDEHSAADAFRKMGLFGAPQAETQAAEPAPEQSDDDGAGGADVPPPASEHDEPAEEDGTPQDDAQTEYFTVKVDGKEERVTRDELLAGYQKDRDYRLKTAKLAEERKALESQRSEIEAARAERQQLAAKLSNVIPALEKQIADKFQNVDWVKLARENPAEWAQMRAEFDAHIGQLEHAKAEKARADQAHAEEFQRTYQQRLKDEGEKLREKIPEFADETKGAKLRADLKGFLKESGLTDTEISGIVDHRMVVIARDAMLYRAAQKSKAQAAQAANVAPKVQRPGASPRTDVKADIRRAAIQKVAKTGSVEDAAAAFRSMKIFG